LQTVGGQTFKKQDFHFPELVLGLNVIRNDYIETAITAKGYKRLKDIGKGLF
jgi:hypothetical protein